MRTHCWLLLPALVAACGGGKPTHCAKPHGIYLVSFEQLSGNCGNPKASVVNADAPDPCNADGNYSADGCTNTIDQTCSPSEGVTTHLIGSLTIDDENADSAHGTATMTITRPDGECSGTYRLTYSRP